MLWRGVQTLGSPLATYSTTLATNAQCVPADSSYGTMPTLASARCLATSPYGTKPVASNLKPGISACARVRNFSSAAVRWPTKRNTVRTFQGHEPDRVEGNVAEMMKI